jgi:hypothetical protein
MADVEHLLRAYFAGEKAEAFWILAAGVAGLVTAIALWSWAREPFARGLAAALLLSAALGLTIDFYAEHRAIKYVRDLCVHGWLTEARRG